MTAPGIFSWGYSLDTWRARGARAYTGSGVRDPRGVPQRQRLNEQNQGANKLWCESTTNPAPVLRIAVSSGFSELAQNAIRSTRGHSTPSLKISCKSVQPFSRNLADKETKIQINKQTKKEKNRSKTIPRPRSTGVGVMIE